MKANGFAYDTAGLERQLRLALEAQRANQPWAVAPPLRTYPLYQFLIKLGNLI